MQGDITTRLRRVRRGCKALYLWGLGGVGGPIEGISELRGACGLLTLSRLAHDANRCVVGVSATTFEVVSPRLGCSRL